MKRAVLVAALWCGLLATGQAQDAKPTALLLDGLGIYVEQSYVGVSALAPELQRQGYRTVTDTHFMRKSSNEVPAVIIGHSMGGMAALKYARRLVQNGYPPPLVITIDAAPGSQTCYVPRCINFYSPGFPQVQGGQNIDAWESGAYLVNHAMLATNVPIQRAILQYTAALIAKPVAPPPPTGPLAAGSPAVPPVVVPRPIPSPRRSTRGS